MPDDAGVKRYFADYEQFKPRFDRGDTLGQMGYMIAEGVVAVLQHDEAADPRGHARTPRATCRTSSSACCCRASS